MCHYTSSNSKSTIIQMKSLYMYCTLYVPHGAEKDIMVTLYIVYQYRCTKLKWCSCFILVVIILFWSRKKISLIGLRLLCLSQLHGSHWQVSRWQYFFFLFKPKYIVYYSQELAVLFLPPFSLPLEPAEAWKPEIMASRLCM